MSQEWLRAMELLPILKLLLKCNIFLPDGSWIQSVNQHLFVEERREDGEKRKELWIYVMGNIYKMYNRFFAFSPLEEEEWQSNHLSAFK